MVQVDPPSLERLLYSNFSSRVRTPSKTHATPLRGTGGRKGKGGRWEC